MEKAFRKRGGNQKADVQCAGRFPENGDVSGVTPECLYVLLDPLESGNLVKQTVVARGIVRRFFGE